MDLYFQIYSRFSGKTPRHKFFACRAATGTVEPLEIPGLDGFTLDNGWWMDGKHPRWLVTHLAPGDIKATVAVVDIDRQEVIDRWNIEGIDRPPSRIAGEGLHFISPARGMLYKADPLRKRLDWLATNPMPVECRNLAASPQGRLGTDTYDCGFAFTRDIKTGEFRDHGPVWIDDHRCNYGPAAFAGEQGQYFLANHGESIEVTALWVTDIETNRHWRVGDSVVQLVRFHDGSVWGTQGANPPALDFDAASCWTPAWHHRPGTLVHYIAGASHVELHEEIGAVGAIADAPGSTGQLYFTVERTLNLYDSSERRLLATDELPAAIIAVVTDYARNTVYIVLADGTVLSCDGAQSGRIEAQLRATGFGSVARGCFILPRSGFLIGVAIDGSVSVLEPTTDVVTHMEGLVPSPAGPAVDPFEDAWYFAHREIVKYTLHRSYEVYRS